MPQSSNATGLARFPLRFLDLLEERGFDRQRVMERVGLTEKELEDPDSRIPLRKMAGLWEIAVDYLADRDVGLHMAEQLRVRDLGLVGYALVHSPTLREALERLTRYSRILAEDLRYSLVEDAGSTRLVLGKSPLLDPLRHPVDVRLAAALSAMREITGRDLAPAEVDLPYPQPESAAEHRRFFRAPVRFSSPRAALTLHENDLRLPVIQSDDNLTRYLDQLAEEVLESLPEHGTFGEQVERALWNDLSAGQPTLQQTARSIGISVRTLQRRLREEGTSFAGVLDRFRHQMALRLLRDRSLAVYEVAFLLGYSEPSTFYRAFRRWCNASPEEYRRTA